jgi:hypothetical protein
MMYICRYFRGGSLNSKSRDQPVLLNLSDLLGVMKTSVPLFYFFRAAWIFDVTSPA